MSFEKMYPTTNGWKWRRYVCKKCGANIPHNWRRLHQYVHGVDDISKITDEELEELYQKANHNKKV